METWFRIQREIESTIATNKDNLEQWQAQQTLFYLKLIICNQQRTNVCEKDLSIAGMNEFVGVSNGKMEKYKSNDHVCMVILCYATFIKKAVYRIQSNEISALISRNPNVIKQNWFPIRFEMAKLVIKCKFRLLCKIIIG